MTEPVPFKIYLNGDAVVGPARSALNVCAQLVPFCLEVARKADLDNPPGTENEFFRLQVHSGDIEPRRLHFEQWLYAKALQEIARGVRRSMEEAALYLWTLGVDGMSAQDFFAEVERTQHKFNAMNFPELLRIVNERLPEPLAFADAYASINRARNCLEHQDGIVLARHLDEASDVMTLALPQYELWATDIEPPLRLFQGTVLEKESQVVIRPGFHKRTFKKGELLTFTSADLHAMAWGCLLFVQDLVTKLPTTK